MADFVGESLGISDWQTIDPESINAFAECTGDRQWIHTDVERARRESPYGSTIAHGFLTLSLVAKFGMALGVVPGDAKAAVNYGLDRVRFLAPVTAGARVRCQISLLEMQEQGSGRFLIKTRNTVEIEGESKPALVADTLILLLSLLCPSKFRERQAPTSLFHLEHL